MVSRTVSNQADVRDSGRFPRLLTSNVPARKMRYYDFKRKWSRRVKPHLGDEKLQAILVREFNKYTWGKWRRRFEQGMYPEEKDNCDWRLNHRGRRPAYWRYVASGACHWLVNFALRLAMLAEPDRAWRIIKSDNHSAVWDGENTLFDLQYYSLGVKAKESWNLLQGGKELRPGQYAVVGYPEHYMEKVRRLQLERSTSTTRQAV